jgi:hypothetical protein
MLAVRLKFIEGRILILTSMAIGLISCATYEFTPIPDKSIRILHNSSNVIPVYQDSTRDTVKLDG